MEENVIPSEEGLKRYENTKGFYEGIPCSCSKECSVICRGECGCHACASAYGDSLEYD